VETPATRPHDVRDATPAPAAAAVPEAALLRIRLLGELRVDAATGPLPLPASRRTRALLAYLAATGCAHTRSALCDLLWDGPDDPRAELRWSLTKLRPVVDRPDRRGLQADREQVALCDAAIEVDIAALRGLLGVRAETLATAALEQASGALAGEFLAGLELPGCHRFHQWCMAERETWAALRVALLAGEQAAAANALHMLSWLAQQCNDIGGTREATLRAELMSRGGDDTARCLQLANTGRCLMEVESDLPKARELVASAVELAQAQSLQVIELEWARGLIARWDGDWDGAQRLVRAAVSIARARQDRWREFECLIWLATIEFERGRWDEVRQLGAEVTQVAARVGGGLNAPFGEALRALAAWGAVAPGEPGPASRAALDASLGHLRTLDDKAHLAYVLNQVAALELGAGHAEAAAAAADEALRAASAVRRSTEIATAKALLARAHGATGELAQLAQGELSARARRVVVAAAAP